MCPLPRSVTEDLVVQLQQRQQLRAVEGELAGRCCRSWLSVRCRWHSAMYFLKRVFREQGIVDVRRRCRGVVDVDHGGSRGGDVCRVSRLVEVALGQVLPGFDRLERRQQESEVKSSGSPAVRVRAPLKACSVTVSSAGPQRDAAPDWRFRRRPPGGWPTIPVPPAAFPGRSWYSGALVAAIPQGQAASRRSPSPSHSASWFFAATSHVQSKDSGRRPPGTPKPMASGTAASWNPSCRPTSFTSTVCPGTELQLSTLPFHRRRARRSAPAPATALPSFVPVQWTATRPGPALPP